MLVKENSSTKIIEDKMEFTFKDLEIIGKYKIGKIDVVFYRNSKKFLFFKSMIQVKLLQLLEFQN